MQRAAARQLTHFFVICPLRRHQALLLLLNATFLPAAGTAKEILPPLHQLLHLHHFHRSFHELRIASRPFPRSVLRNSTCLSVLFRCLSNGSSLRSFIDQNSDGLPSTQHTFSGSQSNLGNGPSTALSEVCARACFDDEELNEFVVDASSVSWILDKHGWGPHTEGILQHFIGNITPDLVAGVVEELKDAKVAFRFIEWAGKQENFQHREEIFTKIVGRLGKSSEYEAVWTVLEFMRQHGLKVNYAFGIFIHRLKSANMVDEAVKAMDSIEILDVTPTVPLYTVAFQLMLSANNFKDTQRLYVKMRHAGLQPDTKLFGTLVSGFAKAGKIDDALFFFEEMKRSGVPPDSLIYTSLIGAFATVGQYGEGQKFYTEMVQNNSLPSVLSHLDLECALYGLSSMEEIQRFLDDLKIRGHLISVRICNSVLQHLLDNRMLMEAVEVFYRLLGPQKWDGSQSPDRRPAKPNVDSYSLLICGLCKEGNLSEALLLFQEMLGNGFQSRAEVCNCLLHGLSRSEGFMYEAVELSTHIARANLIVDVETQKAFFRALHTVGYISKARQIFDTMKWRGCIDPRSDFDALVYHRA